MVGKHTKRVICGVKYVSRRINGVPMYSICTKRKGHWGKHGR